MLAPDSVPPIEWLNDNSGAVQAISVVALVLVTWVYAMAARRQAHASINMAEEMREQRLSEGRPYLLIDLKDSTPDVVKRRLAKGESIHDFYPTSLKLEVRNEGRGPAKDVRATTVHPKMTFFDERRGYLLKDMSWGFDLRCAPLYRRLMPPRALRDWLADRQIRPPVPIGSPLGVLVTYSDMHDRGWVSYLELEYDAETDDETGEYIVWIEPGKQATIGPLPYEILRDRVSIERLTGS
jgi:hypothetical protein